MGVDEYFEHPLIKKETVLRRDYQVSITTKALDRPTLVVLPTGLGKTVIALMLIAERLKNGDGPILMLAPTKPLVEQHRHFLEESLLDVRVGMLTGEVTVEQVLPTMIHWLGIKNEKIRDLEPSLLSPDESGRDYRIAENRRGPVQEVAVYSNNFALIRNEDTGRVMLFNRATDPLCLENIQLLMPETVQGLINKLGEDQ